MRSVLSRVRHIHLHHGGPPRRLVLASTADGEPGNIAGSNTEASQESQGMHRHSSYRFRNNAA